MSPKYTLNELDWKKISQTLAYSGLSAILAALIVIVEGIEFPPEYLFIVPVINSVLYALQRFFRGV